MNVRERMEQEEYEFLSPQAQKAAETKGRPEPEADNDVRTCYQRDADRILHSKSFRRLMHKTQVFLSPEGDHYRTTIWATRRSVTREKRRCPACWISPFATTNSRFAWWTSLSATALD